MLHHCPPLQRACSINSAIVPANVKMHKMEMFPTVAACVKGKSHGCSSNLSRNMSPRGLSVKCQKRTKVRNNLGIHDGLSIKEMFSFFLKQRKEKTKQTQRNSRFTGQRLLVYIFSSLCWSHLRLKVLIKNGIFKTWALCLDIWLCKWFTLAKGFGWVNSLSQ